MLNTFKKYDDVILNIVAKAGKKGLFYGAIYNQSGIEAAPPVVRALKDLTKRGFISRTREEPRNVRYTITNNGAKMNKLFIEAEKL